MAPSNGSPCSGCDEVIGTAEQVYFVAIRRALLLRFHDTCYYAWAKYKT